MDSLIKRLFTSLLLALLGACTVRPYWPTETDYPANAIARVVKRNGIASAPIVDPSTPLSISIVGTKHGAIPFVTGDGGLVRTTPYTHYELLTNDGEILLVQSESEFALGTCVALSGYADGPSRTHYSLGRARLESSDGCNQ
jgi:hypothetical protein